jgi:hypothetical protein
VITKKDIPYDLLKTIEPLAQANLDIIQLRKEDSTYYCIYETDNNSKNFFKIYFDGVKRIGNYDKTKYAFECKPANSSTAKHIISQVSLSDLGSQFQIWINLVRDIHETPSVHDDNFVKQYSDFYFKEFEILEADAYTFPFNPDQQDVIEDYLLALSMTIEESGERLSSSIKSELINDIHLIQSNLVTTTKNQVIRGIAKVFGKLYTASKTLTKEIVTEARKQLAKKLVKVGIEYGPKILEEFTKL